MACVVSMVSRNGAQDAGRVARNALRRNSTRNVTTPAPGLTASVPCRALLKNAAGSWPSTRTGMSAEVRAAMNIKSPSSSSGGVCWLPSLLHAAVPRGCPAVSSSSAQPKSHTRPPRWRSQEAVAALAASAWAVGEGLAAGALPPRAPEGESKLNKDEVLPPPAVPAVLLAVSTRGGVEGASPACLLLPPHANMLFTLAMSDGPGGAGAVAGAVAEERAATVAATSSAWRWSRASPVKEPLRGDAATTWLCWPRTQAKVPAGSMSGGGSAATSSGDSSAVRTRKER